MGELKQSIVDALHQQLHREHQAHYFYRQTAFWYDLNLFPGIAKFFKVTLLP